MLTVLQNLCKTRKKSGTIFLDFHSSYAMTIWKIVAYVWYSNFMTTVKEQWKLIGSKLSHNSFSPNHWCWMIRLIHINFIPLLSSTAQCHVRNRWCGKIIHWGVANWYHSKLTKAFQFLFSHFIVDAMFFKKIYFQTNWN